MLVKDTCLGQKGDWLSDLSKSLFSRPQFSPVQQGGNIRWGLRPFLLFMLLTLRCFSQGSSYCTFEGEGSIFNWERAQRILKYRVSGFSPLITLSIPGYPLINRQVCVSYQGIKGDGEQPHHCLERMHWKKLHGCWHKTQ